MGVTKSILFTQNQNELAYFSKVLAHPARVAIIEHLLLAKTCCNTLLVDELGLAQATVSQHLRELKTIGLLRGNIDGTTINYCIDAEKWAQFKKVFYRLFENNVDEFCKSSC